MELSHRRVARGEAPDQVGQADQNGGTDVLDVRVVSQLVGPALVGPVFATAKRWGVTPGEALIACGLVSHPTYARALAAAFGVPVQTTAVSAAGMAAKTVLVDATLDTPTGLWDRVVRLQASGHIVVLAPRDVMEEWEQRLQREDRLDRAVNQLLRQTPELSAASPIASWQLVLLVVLIGLFVGGVLVEPGPTRASLMAVVALPFFCVVLLRLLALWLAFTRPRSAPINGAARIADTDLPVYSVLVPLFREVAVLPGLIDALSRLDYPAAKLDCILVLESCDLATRAAVATMMLPPFMRVVVVPAGGPQTKPKALNYALPIARGSYIVVYDAEDVPAPSQLRQVLGVFRAHAATRRAQGGLTSGPVLACVQARLNIDNANDSWLTRQFTLEYTALFDGLLPALARMGLPVPLGGTSNHFPRALLEQLGGWDPYNVTEDADVGLRMARAGLAVAMVRSTTWEEAPLRFQPWLYQRTRWMKGWMQTWLVHMRHPRRCWRELGALKFFGAQALMGGMVLSALMHPVFYLMLAVELLTGDPLALPIDGWDRALWSLAAFNLLAGYSSAMLLAALTVVRRRRLWLLPHVALMPVYWLLISFASYRAAWQLLRQPFLWEKTEHRARPTSPLSPTARPKRARGGGRPAVNRPDTVNRP
jgi:glycosyltransferase XagB